MRFPCRYQALQKAKGDLVIFLDGDCKLPDPRFLYRCQNFFANNPHIQVAGGRYLNSTTSKYWDRAYNFLCSLWLGEPGITHNLLGGCLIINKSSLRLSDYKEPDFWGGEDTYFIRSLQKAGHICYFSESLSVIHCKGGSLLKWIHRGFRHGYNGAMHNLFSPKRNCSLLWNKETAIYLLPLIVHGLALVTGKWFFFLTSRKLRASRPASQS